MGQSDLLDQRQSKLYPWVLSDRCPWDLLDPCYQSDLSHLLPDLSDRVRLMLRPWVLSDRCRRDLLDQRQSKLYPSDLSDPNL